MSTTEFTPERSAAIRQLLIDTVEDEPRRRKRLQLLLTSVLAGVAVALAGGTAALALTGVLHFGGATPPAPVPTPTPTHTATPSPTPTPRTTPALVQSATVLPRDVDTLAPRTRWSLDLPGSSDCTGTRAYSLSDGRAVYLSGLRPKEYEGAPGTEDCSVRPDEHLGLTLVDTSDGKVLWTREWRFTPKRPTYQVGFTVLGTSGRALLDYPGAESGPHEVIDLENGERVATFAPDWPGFAPSRDIQAVPGSSGDVLVIKRDQDAEGRSLGTDALMRVDPADISDPVWTASLPGVKTTIDPPAADAGVVATEGWSPDSDRGETTLIALDTGETTALPPTWIRSMSQILLAQPKTTQTGTTTQTGEMTITGYALDGREAWSKQVPGASQIFAASSPGSQVIGAPDTGEFFVADGATISLFDQATGKKRWSAATSACWQGGHAADSAMLDVVNDAFVLSSGSDRCELSHSSGEPVAGIRDLPTDGVDVFGLTNVYSHGHLDASSPDAAYSLSTGKRLWTLDGTGGTWWSFDGGYLVSAHGNHIESIG